MIYCSIVSKLKFLHNYIELQRERESSGNRMIVIAASAGFCSAGGHLKC